MKLRIRTLGESVMEVGEQQIRPDAEILFALLLLLAAEGERGIPRERLKQVVWPGMPEQRAAQCLRQAIYKIRRMGVDLDVTLAHVSLLPSNTEADFALVGLDGPGVPAPAADEFLPGYAPDFSEPFTAWLEVQRDVVRGRIRHALALALVDRRNAGRWSEAEEIARRILGIDPLNEEATLALAEARALSGSKAEALSILDGYLADVGQSARDLRLPASVLRRRIAERPDSDAYIGTGEGPFVGRDAQLRVMHECARRSRAGTSTSCYVWGEPGIGKSRLAGEFIRSELMLGGKTLRVSCQSVDAHRALGVFADLVPGLLALPGALGCSPESLEHIRRLTAGTRGDEAERLEPDEADARAAAVRRSLLELFDAVSSESRLLILVEDTHWADSASLRLLRELVDWAGSRPLQLVMTSRTAPAFGSGRAADSSSTLVVQRLGPLSPEATSALLLQLAAGTSLAANAEFAGWAARVSEGNPFLVRELYAHWRHTGEEYSVPPSLESLLAWRISELSDESLRVLQMCAVLRRQSRLDRLRALLGMENSALLDALQALGNSALLTADGDRLECSHELIADAALAQMSEVGLAALYRLGAELLEEEAKTTAATSVLWDCARLWHLAGNEERAVEVSLRCAQQLIAQGSPRDAAALLGFALEFSSRPEVQLSIHSLLTIALDQSGQRGQLLEQIPEKRALVQLVHGWSEQHDSDELLLLDSAWRTTGQPVQVLAHAIRCLSATEADATHRLVAAEIALNVADGQCDVESASLIERLARDVAAGPPASRRAKTTVGMMYETSYGSLEDGAAHAALLLAMEREGGTAASFCRALRYSSVPLRRLGNHDQAIANLLEALRIADRHQLASAAFLAVEAMIQVYLDKEDISGARHWLTFAESLLTKSEDYGVASGVRFLGVVIRLLKGERVAADAVLDAALEKHSADPVTRRRAHFLALHARILADARPHRVGKALLDDAVAVHHLAKARGGQDFNLWNTCVALKLCGRKSQAATLLGDYLNRYRREAWPPPGYLQTCVE